MTSFPIGTVSVPAIPKTRAQPQTLPLITTSTALLVLLNPMEYEATTMYLLRMLVRDTTSGLVGNLTVQVNNFLYFMNVQRTSQKCSIMKSTYKIGQFDCTGKKMFLRTLWISLGRNNLCLLILSASFIYDLYMQNTFQKTLIYFFTNVRMSRAHIA